MRELDKSFQLLADFPHLGHKRTEARDIRLLYFPVNRFVVAYLPETKPLQIIRVVGARRDFRRLFRKR